MRRLLASPCAARVYRPLPRSEAPSGDSRFKRRVEVGFLIGHWCARTKHALFTARISQLSNESRRRGPRGRSADGAGHSVRLGGGSPGADASPRARSRGGPGTAPPLCNELHIARPHLNRWRNRTVPSPPAAAARLQAWALSRDPQVRANLPNHVGSSMVASRRTRPRHSGQARTSIWKVRRRSSAHGV